MKTGARENPLSALSAGLLAICCLGLLGLSIGLGQNAYERTENAVQQRQVFPGSPSPIQVQIAECFPNPVSVKMPRLIEEAGLGSSADEASRIMSVLCSESELAGIDPLLVLAIIEEESRFSADAVSPRGASGLMQVMPSTGRLVAPRARINPSDLDLFDPVVNIKLGVRYFGSLMRQFKDTRAALAAYVSGPTRVADYIMTTGEIPAEEDGYAARVLRRYARLRLKVGFWGRRR